MALVFVPRTNGIAEDDINRAVSKKFICLSTHYSIIPANELEGLLRS